MLMVGRPGLLCCFAVVLPVLGCREQSERKRGDQDAVYQELLHAQFRNPQWSKDGIVISTSRAELYWIGYPEPKRWALFSKSLKELRRDTYDDFLTNLHVHAIARPTFTVIDGVAVEIVSGSRIDQLFSGASVEESWKRYREAYGKATPVEFSAVGFSRDGSQALVLLNAVGWFGSYFVLEKSIGEWKVVEECEVWVS